MLLKRAFGAWEAQATWAHFVQVGRPEHLARPYLSALLRDLRQFLQQQDPAAGPQGRAQDVHAQLKNVLKLSKQPHRYQFMWGLSAAVPG